MKMTDFEKELKPIEDWIEEKLKGRLPYSRDLDVFFCAALIKQYQSEQLNIPVVAKQRELLNFFAKDWNENQTTGETVINSDDIIKCIKNFNCV